MAQKKITDLQLISNIVDGLSVPSDNGTQSYRFTIAQLTSFLFGKFTSQSVVTPLAADHLPLLDASDSDAMKRATVASIRNAVYRSVTTTDSVGVDDETMVLSGASFTSTLPTAVGVTGKRYRFIHNGTSFSQVYTLATTSSETIGPFASAAIALYMKGDILEVQSDGANWIIVYKNTKSGLYLDTANGYGSTNNKVPRFSNSRYNFGSDITYADSAANGASVTVNYPGLYCVEFMVSEWVAAEYTGVTVNGSALTTGISTTTYANGKRGAVFGVINRGSAFSSTFPCDIGDVIRPHTNGLAIPATDNSIFKVTKVQ